MKRKFRMIGDRSVSDFSLGFLAVGKKGSGKSSIVTKIFNQAIEHGHGVVAIDVGDFLVERAWARAPHGTRVVRHNATRRDGRCVHLARLARTQPQIETFAAKLLPSDPNDRNAYFTSNGQDLIEAVLKVLNYFAPGDWLPGDLTWLCSNRRLFEALCDETNGVVSNPLRNLGGGHKDVWGTMRSAVRNITTYCALADHLPLHDPLKAVRRREGVVILEWADNVAKSLERVYAIVLDVCAAESLSARNPDRYLWFFCDEVRSLVKMEFLTAMALRGRRPKANLVMTVHEIEGIFDRYGQNAGTELLNMMGMKVFLRIGGAGTAKWAAELMTKREVIETVQQEHGGSSRSVKEKYAVPPGEFLTLPYPDVENDRIEGYALTPDHRGKYATKFLADTTLDDKPAPGRRCPKGWYTPRPRGEEDLKRLNMPFKEKVLKALKNKPSRKDEEEEEHDAKVDS